MCENYLHDIYFKIKIKIHFCTFDFIASRGMHDL